MSKLTLGIEPATGFLRHLRYGMVVQLMQSQDGVFNI